MVLLMVRDRGGVDDGSSVDERGGVDGVDGAVVDLDVAVAVQPAKGRGSQDGDECGDKNNLNSTRTTCD